MPSPVFAFQVRVYYEDTDTGGIVYYANYLKFFERARTEWLRTHGISQYELTQNSNLIFVVRSTAMDYLRAARLDDLLTIRSTVGRLGRVSVEFLQQAWRASDGAELAKPLTTPAVERADKSEGLLASGRIKVACVDRNTLQPTPFPDHFRQAFQS